MDPRVRELVMLSALAALGWRRCRVTYCSSRSLVRRAQQQLSRRYDVSAPGLSLSLVHRRAPNQAASAALVSWSSAPADQLGADGTSRPVAWPWRVGALLRSAPCRICASG